MSRLLWVVLMAAGVAPGASAGHAPVSRVLVMPFAVQADAAGPNSTLAVRWLGEAAATLLADQLGALGYGALPREERVAVFTRLHLPMSPELTRATMIRVGELIGATEIVYGEVRYDTDLSVRARTISLDTGQLLPEVTARGDLAEIFTLFAQIGREVGDRLGRPPAGEPASPLEPMPLPALENYVKGLMAATPAAQQRFLEGAMAQAPGDGRVLTALWAVYADQGLHEEALAVVSAVPASDPQYRRARFDVALSLIELRRFDAASKELAALHAGRAASALSNALGVVELRRAAPPAGAAAAAPYFQQAAGEAPSDTDYLFNLGYARALAGDRDGALSVLREAVRHNAADGDAHLVMSALLAAGGRSTEAQRELDLARLLGTALEAVPAAIADVPPSLERLRTGLDDTLLLAPAFGGISQRDQTETAGFYLSRGRSLAGDGRDREAMADLQRSIYLSPYQDEPHLLLGEIYERAGRLGEAIDEFKVAIWCRDTAAARIALGRAFFESGDREAARGEFDRALILAPGSSEARDWIRKIGGLPAAGGGSAAGSGMLR